MSTTDPWVLEQRMHKELEEAKARLDPAADLNKIENAKLRNEILSAKLEQKEAELLRLSYPALKDAWDKYQTVLKMVKP